MMIHSNKLNFFWLLTTSIYYKLIKQKPGIGFPDFCFIIKSVTIQWLTTNIIINNLDLIATGNN